MLEWKTIKGIVKLGIKDIIYMLRLENNRKNLLRGGAEDKILGIEALNKLLKDYEFNTVLDIGCGAGKHAEIFLSEGKAVTAIDYGKSLCFEQNSGRLETIVADFNTYNFDKQFDCVWCCHCLEHQLNVQIFLEKINVVLKDGGVLALVVPPLKHMIVGGHVNLFNAGLLLYRLVLAGFDCREASMLAYGYNICVLLKKRKIEVLENISYDCGDLRTLHQYFPEELEYHESRKDIPFEGRILKINW